MESDGVSVEGYNAPPEFKEDGNGPLIELSETDSTEFWLIQWPLNQQATDFAGKELSLKLHHDGTLGSVEGSSGKSYEVVSYDGLAPNATVFVPSGSNTKVVGKISRRVSLVHYPEPSELVKQNTKNPKQYERSVGTSLTNSYATPQSHRRSSKSTRTGSASMHTGKHRGPVPMAGDLSKSSKKRHSEEATRSVDRSTQDSGRTHSGVTSAGSMEHSSERKSKKKNKQNE